MILKEFCVYDSKAEAALPKFLSPTCGLAMRMLEEAVNNIEHQFNKHAADYTLFELGTFDCSSMATTSLQTPLNLGCLITFLAEVPDYGDQLRDAGRATVAKTAKSLFDSQEKIDRIYDTARAAKETS